MWKSICFVLFGLGAFSEDSGQSIVILKQTFTIEGETSVGDFTCSYELDQRNTVNVNSNPDGNSSVQYTIPSDAFGCHNFLLTRDFKKTIKAKEHKDIKIEIFGITRIQNHYMCNLRIKLAGKEKVYMETPLRTRSKSIQGSLVVQFSEFDLKPPKKLGGLVKVKEDIKISIALDIVQ